jgi:DNA polymerase III sliding clamp (beta) subunit (PCNA family)
MIRVATAKNDRQAELLVAIFRALSAFKSQDNTRRVLTGVMIRGTTMIATDGRRLGMVNLHEVSDKDLIAAGIAHGLLQADNKERLYEIVKASNKELVVMEMDNCTYPNYLQVIPGMNPADNGTDITLRHDDGALQWEVSRKIINRTMHRQRPDVNGKTWDVLEESKLCINFNYLMEGVNFFRAAGEDMMTMLYQDDHSPLCFRGMVPEVPTPEVPATTNEATGEVTKAIPPKPDSRPYHVRMGLKDEKGAYYGLTYVLMPLRIS